MPIVRKCGTPRCFNAAEHGKRLCPDHLLKAAEREARRSERRVIAEPWRALYDTNEWSICKRAVRRRDGNRCVKCGSPSNPQVHHKARIAVLWFRAGEDWWVFLEMATNPEICETLCPSCHKIADNEMREQQGTIRALAESNGKEFARPRVPASKRGKRR